MGNNLNSTQAVNPFQNLSLISREEVLSLGKIEIYKENNSDKYFMLLITSYSIPNQEMA